MAVKWSETPNGRIQRTEARLRANQIRQRRAKLKQDIKARRESAKGHLLAPPEYINGMRIFDLICSIKGFGHVKATKFCRDNHISHGKKIGDMTERQRFAIAEKLPW